MKICIKAIDEIYDLSYTLIKWSIPICLVYMSSLYIFFTYPLLAAIENGFYAWGSLLIASVLLHLVTFYYKNKIKT